MNITEIVKNFKSLCGFGNTPLKLETFLWIFNYVLKSVTWSLFDLKASNSRDGVNLLIGSNLKLALVPCAISEWPILFLFYKHIFY